MPRIEPNFFLPEGADINVNPNTRRYTNADLPQEFHPPDVLDDGTENLDASPPDVMDDEEVNTPASTRSIVSDKEPGTYWEGFKNSIMNGEGFNLGKSLSGYAKGTFLDLPKNLMSLPRNIFHSLSQAGELSGGIDNNFVPDEPSNLPNDPEEFGRLMGNLTGQPLLTEGLVKGAPPAIRTAGYPTELAGRIMKKYAPVSGTLPRVVEPRILRNIEQGIGRGVEKLGSKMKTVGKSSIKQGELVSEELPNIKNGDVVQPIRKQLPPSKVFHYGNEGTNPPKIKVVDGKITGPVESPLQEGQSLTPDAEVSFRRPLQEGEDLTPKSKPKVRLMPDGSFVNLDTGEMFDAKGQPMGAKAAPQIDKNSPFFKKNQPSLEAVQPTNIGQIIKNIPKSGNIEFDSALNKLQTLRNKTRSGTGLSDAELSQYQEAATIVRNHPDMPPELAKAWKDIGAANKARGPKFSPGDKVKIKELPIDKRSMRERIKEIEKLPN